MLRAVKAAHPDAEIRFWCDRSFYKQASSIVHQFDDKIPVHKIHSGKFRRYNHLSWWRQLLMPSITLRNIRDGFLVFAGILQSIAGLVMWRPDVVFTKGGFVCLPVGLAAHMLRIPLVIHDSDAHPGLTNRILARYAIIIATGAPLKFYSYPASKSHYVGIPVAPECMPLSDEQRLQAKVGLGFSPDWPLVVVTGGGLGARRINDLIVRSLDELLETTSVMLIAGAGQYDELVPLVGERDSSRFQLHAFVSPIIPAIGAADIVVGRAGATTLLELAAMAKATIIIPNGQLTGGHQLKNAAVYEQEKAAVVINEQALQENPTLLTDKIHDLLSQPDKRHALEHRINTLSKPEAASDMAQLLDQALRHR